MSQVFRNMYKLTVPKDTYNFKELKTHTVFIRIPKLKKKHQKHIKKMMEMKIKMFFLVLKPS